MPALASTLLLNNIAGRNESLNAATSLAANATENVIQVVCAWPVSGQYGPGSRILYYCLVAACVIARKVEWLRNACLAAALIFPAVAALHSIVLAAIHNDSAVDMDVYGAFQFCSIGILAAPLTVRISRTYFYDPGRNIIFLWTGMVLVGLLSLTVEFFRINSVACNYDLPSFPREPTPDDFDHLYQVCHIPCSINEGPFSPLRQGSANEIAIIPTPSKFTFNAITLVAAACCIPAVLSLASMWNKILEINWKSKFGRRDEDQFIEGTNGATIQGMSRVNTMIRLFLSTLEVPLLSGIVLTILIVGEMNLFSPEVSYQTEPITSIGQWAPIVGTALAALGSLYLILAADLDAVEEENNQKPPMNHCNCSHHHIEDVNASLNEHPGVMRRPSSLGAHSCAVDSPERDESGSPAMREVGLFAGHSHIITSPDHAHLRPGSGSDSGRETSSERMSTTSRAPVDVGHRRKVAKALMSISNYLGTASQDRFDDSEFKHGKALDFPEIPAEEIRNPDLPHIREVYNQPHDEDANKNLSKRPSRSGSFTGSIYSRPSVENSAAMSRTMTAPHPPSPVSRSSSPSSPTPPGLRHASTLPTHGSSDLEVRGRPKQRRDTLEVPEQMHQGSLRNTQSDSPITTTTVNNGPGSPIIVISPDPNSPTEEIPSLNMHIAPSSPEPASLLKAPASPP
ncbi:hypothetical protein F4821DRAFT_162852 [Hypoxylon rubiginosum]|uniref:Uncharacterized protein n=1 Tax=Hypoxylon rubiginosum TaxID=110542 RepID=A0ACC0CX13_9PEZI|nr:hypothetical protein F4821DRAFT_162852 [Hypoxylon rubiginosum]